MGIQDREHLQVTTVHELSQWLDVHHLTSPGLWIVTHKKASGVAAPSYDEIVRALLCYGWVDSISGKVDHTRSKLYASPRKPTSAWSQSNKIRVQELTEQGLMLPAGLAKVEEAKLSGQWTLIDQAQNAEIPQDLEQLFNEYPSSRENFEQFPRGVRKQILEWITQAKTAETRKKRMVETATLAQKNIRANQWRDKKKAEQANG